MKKLWLLTVLLSVSFLFAGCNHEAEKATSEKATGNPTAKDILSKNPEADIFMFNRIIYSNAADIDWVKEQELTSGEEVTEITKQTTDREAFESGTATKLSAGTKIYESVEESGIYIAVVNGEEIPYIGLIEG